MCVCVYIYIYVSAAAHFIYIYIYIKCAAALTVTNKQNMDNVSMRSRVYVIGRSIFGVAGSNPAEGVDVHHLYLLCTVQVAVSATG